MTTSSPRFAVHAHRHSHQLQLGSFPLPVSQKGRLSVRLIRVWGAAVLWLALFVRPLPALAASQIDLAGPPGSGQFGRTVTALPNGNIVVTDPGYDNGALLDVGAVYLYDGATGALISKLTGSNPADQIGVQGVTVLSNGNYIVRSPLWRNQMGAVTWVSATTGINGVVDASNSLVGGTTGDLLGDSGVITLTNGNYLVITPHWHNGSVEDAGAVTWGNGATGITGVVSGNNSLVGSHTYDLSLNPRSITPLSNGNYVVDSPLWSNGAASYAGAVTWGNGLTGVSGVISRTNSLIGVATGDAVGNGGVTALSNGNYVVSSPYWSTETVKSVGAATWGNGATGLTGVISHINSLIGRTATDQVGGYGITALTNGNYVVRSPGWHNASMPNAGAVTWGNGTTGVTGVVSSTNSLVGSTTDDKIGSSTVLALSNGNYVVSSPDWSNRSASNAGAVTWGNGITGTSGIISSTNSLVGQQVEDLVGAYGATALSNGNYVVISPYWHNGTVVDAGAVTWGNGITGVSGVVSSANSLVGSTANDRVGASDSFNSVTPLKNGNYVVVSPHWHNAGRLDAGAVTWGNGATGSSGEINASNSLIGSTIGDRLGYSGVSALPNGNYVVSSPFWSSITAVNAGAATWGNGATGISGLINSSNSLIGSTSGDWVGYNGVTALSNGNYVVSSPLWANGAAVQAGAVTWGNGATGISGFINSTNSLVGGRAEDEVGVHNFINDDVTALNKDNYVVISPFWGTGAVARAGAITWGSGVNGVAGLISTSNSVTGATPNNGFSLNFAYDAVHQQLVVGRPGDNKVTLFRFLPNTSFHQGFLPVVKK